MASASVSPPSQSISQPYAREPSPSASSLHTFIAELDSTPISSMPPKSDLSNHVSVTQQRRASLGSVASSDDDSLTPQERELKRAKKVKDPAVLVNLPTTPSAQAYEVVQQKRIGSVQDGNAPVSGEQLPTEEQAADSEQA
jgi:hypothetical protein